MDKGPHQLSAGGDDSSINFLSRESQGRFRRLIESILSGVYIADAKGHLIYVNSAFVTMLGFHNKEEVLGLNLNRSFQISRRDRFNILKKLLRLGFIKDFEIEYKRNDGLLQTLSVTSSFVRDDYGRIIGLEGIVLDVTENKKLREALVTEKKKLEQILDFGEKVSSVREFKDLMELSVQEIPRIMEARRCSLMFIDKQTHDLYIEAAQGLEADKIKETRVKIGEGLSGYVAKHRHAILVKNIEYDERFRRGNRERYRNRSFLIVPITIDEDLIGLINVADKCVNNIFTELTELDLKILSAIAREIAVAIENLKVFEELNLLSVTDPLTQVYNFRQFSKSLNYEIKRLERVEGDLCLIMMDVDDFKSYNDAFGHLAGDELLRTLTLILKSKLRETDIVCRYAGDEFAIILPNADLPGAEAAARKIVEAIEEHVFKRKVTVSLGLVHYQKGMGQKDLIALADQALYKAKGSGKNTYCTY